MEKKATERRVNPRFGLRLPMRYRISQKGIPDRMGSGMTYEISAGGMSFRCRKPLPEGAHIDAVVDWPAKYEGVYPIDLQVSGFVMRSDTGRTAVRLTSSKLRVNTERHPIRATA
jgi:hypothetical protein